MIGDPGEFLWKHGILNYNRPMTPGFFLSADVKDGELRASTKVLLNNHSHDKHDVKKRKKWLTKLTYARGCWSADVVARFHFKCCGVPPLQDESNAYLRNVGISEANRLRTSAIYLT